MKVFTYNNKTTGRQNETLHAETKEEVLEQMAKLGFQVEITDVFDPDSLFADNPMPKDIQNAPQPINNDNQKTMLFETNGIQFKIVGDSVYKKDWIEIDDKSNYKVVRALRGKNDSIREQNITDDITIYKHDWIKVDKKDEE